MIEKITLKPENKNYYHFTPIKGQASAPANAFLMLGFRHYLLYVIDSNLKLFKSAGLVEKVNTRSRQIAMLEVAGIK